MKLSDVSPYYGTEGVLILCKKKPLNEKVNVTSEDFFRQKR